MVDLTKEEAKVGLDVSLKVEGSRRLEVEYEPNQERNLCLSLFIALSRGRRHVGLRLRHLERIAF